MNKSYISRMKSNTGFTLAETLLTVAIMVILMGVAFVNAKSMRDNARQASMDQTAKTMYMALSENMKLIETTGNVSDFSKAASSDRIEGKDIYVTSRKKGIPSKLQNYLIPAGSITEEILQGDWTIIYDTGEESMNESMNPATKEVTVTYRSPSIRAVYYTPQSSGIKYYDEVISKISTGTETADEPGILTVYAAETESDKGFLYSDKQERLNKFNGLLGYYDGEASEDLENKLTTENDFVCWYEVDNGEELLVHVYVNVPDDEKYKNGTGFATVNLYLTLAGSKGSVTLDKATLENVTVSGPKTRTIGTKDVPYVEEYTFVLDSLKVESSTTGTSSEHKQFKNLTYKYKDGTSDKTALVSSVITPGENIGLSVAADCNGYEASFLSIDEYKPVKVVNTLYAKSTPAKDGDTSYESIEVSCGRHLQNLDRSLSGFATTKDEVRVKLTDNIDFAKNSEGEKENKSWFATYGNASFYPINNNKIATFDGNDKSISNLVITEDATEPSYYKMTKAGIDAIGQKNGDSPTKAVQNHQNNNGLFAVFYGYKLENLTLINPIINCTENDNTATNAGAIAGTLAGEIVDNSKTIAINKCGVYLDYEAATDNENKNSYLKNTNVNGTSWNTANNTVWIKGNTCIGGLVGNVATGGNVKATGLTITNSYSATVVKAGMAMSYGGGLVGQSTLKMDVDTSYADCYISAGNVGGLAGDVVANTSFKDCYSAGFVLQGKNKQVGDLIEKAAGYTPSNVNVTLSGNNYSLFNYDDVTSDAFTTTALTFKTDDGVIDKYPDRTPHADSTVAEAKIVGCFAPKATLSTDAKAYFTYGDLASAKEKGEGEYMSVSDMKKATGEKGLGLSGRTISGENPTEIPYNLSLQDGQSNYESGYTNRHKLTMPVFWDSSKTDAPQTHYGDWLEKPGSKVKKYKINFVDVRKVTTENPNPEPELIDIFDSSTDNFNESIFRKFSSSTIKQIRVINGENSEKLSFIGFDKVSNSGESPKYTSKISMNDFIDDGAVFVDITDKNEADMETTVYIYWKKPTYKDWTLTDKDEKKIQSGDEIVITSLTNNTPPTVNKCWPATTSAQTDDINNFDNLVKINETRDGLTISSGEIDTKSGHRDKADVFKDYIWHALSPSDFAKRYPQYKSDIMNESGSMKIDDKGFIIFSTVYYDTNKNPYILKAKYQDTNLDGDCPNSLNQNWVWYYDDGDLYNETVRGENTEDRYLDAQDSGWMVTLKKGYGFAGRAYVYKSSPSSDDTDISDFLD